VFARKCGRGPGWVAAACRRATALQSTCAARFNRFRDSHGYLFQGRYKSLLVEPGESLGRHRKSESDALRAPKGAEWKIAIAARLRTECLTPNAWIARRLHMGHPHAVSFHVGRWLRRQT